MKCGNVCFSTTSNICLSVYQIPSLGGEPEGENAGRGYLSHNITLQVQTSEEILFNF